MGAPGVGKGTVAGIVAAKLNIPHISTGEMFRREIARGSELGNSISELIANGNFVPDDLTSSLVFKRLGEEDCKGGYILDGYPRDIVQAKIFDEHTRNTGTAVDKVILLTLSEDIIIKRLEGRRNCHDCGATFNINFHPPKKEGVCDKCSGPLLQRQDDKPEVIKSRLIAYHKLTEPLIDYYERRQLLFRVDNSGYFKDTAEIITAEITGMDG